MRRQQGVLDCPCRAPGGRETDRLADAGDAVNAAIGFAEHLDDRGIGARQVRQRPVGVRDLALERRGEAVTHLGEAFGEFIKRHGWSSPLEANETSVASLELKKS